jgi:hypothetical protein
VGRGFRGCRKSLTGTGLTQAAEKLKFLSFRGTLRAEESLILLNLKPGEIPRFARNDKIIYFFRSLLSGTGTLACAGFAALMMGAQPRVAVPPGFFSNLFSRDIKG